MPWGCPASDGLGESGPRALDLRGLGARRLLESTEWADPEIESVFADGPEPSSLTGVSAYRTKLKVTGPDETWVRGVFA
jgi:hypothetical protein